MEGAHRNIAMNKRKSGLISCFHGLITEKVSVCFDNCAWDRAPSAAFSCDSVLLSSLTRLLWCLDRHKPDAALAGPIATLVRGFDSWKKSEEQLLAAEWKTKTRRPNSVVTRRAPSSMLSQSAHTNQQRDLLASPELQ